jgi:hypothetical protein
VPPLSQTDEGSEDIMDEEEEEEADMSVYDLIFPESYHSDEAKEKIVLVNETKNAEGKL